MLVGKRSFERHQANRGVTQGLDNRLAKKANQVFKEQAVEKEETHKQNLARCVASKIQSLQKAQVIYL